MRPLVITVLALAACDTPPSRPPDHANALDAGADAPPDQPKVSGLPVELRGKWTGGGSGGGIGWTATYEHRDDGTFHMTGYPQIEVNGRITVTHRSANRFHVKISERMMSSGDAPSPRADVDEWWELSPDGKSLKMGEETYSKQ